MLFIYFLKRLCHDLIIYSFNNILGIYLNRFNLLIRKNEAFIENHQVYPDTIHSRSGNEYKSLIFKEIDTGNIIFKLRCRWIYIASVSAYIYSEKGNN
jgi:hypothetical protein